MGIRLGVRAASGRRVRAPRVNNGLISCSWLHLLKVWSLFKTGANQTDMPPVGRAFTVRRPSLREATFSRGGGAPKMTDQKAPTYEDRPFHGGTTLPPHRGDEPLSP